MKRNTLGLLLLFVVLVLSAADKPNVTLIIADDLNDYQSAIGGHAQAITAHIDALASSGTKFTKAQTNSSLCVPSNNRLLSGVYPFHSNDLCFEACTPLTPQADATNPRIGLGYLCKEQQVYPFVADVRVPEGTTLVKIRKAYTFQGGFNKLSDNSDLNEQGSAISITFTGKDGCHVLYVKIKDLKFVIDNMWMFTRDVEVYGLNEEAHYNGLKLYSYLNIGVLKVENENQISPYTVYDSQGRCAMLNADIPS